MENIILTQISIAELKNFISDAVKTGLQNLSNSQPEKETTELLTRLQTAKILNVSLPTLNDWTKKGIIKGYKINSRVRYKKSEVFEALKLVDKIKYQRS